MREQDRTRGLPVGSHEKSHTRAQPNAKERSGPAANPGFDLQRTAGNQAVVNLFESGTLQAKLRVSQPTDADEVEADRVADQIAGSPAPSADSAASGTIHRKCDCPGGVASCPACEEEQVEQRKGIHRKSSGSAQEELSVRDDFLQSLGPGQPLAAENRTFMESRFGEDFGQVLLHTDERAANSARSLRAKAYTFGEHVVFDSGAYEPNTSSGKKLLAHELSHVTQQRGGNMRAAAPSLSPVGQPKVQRQFGEIVSALTGVPEPILDVAISPYRQLADDLVASVREAPDHASEILVGEVWDAIKEHWRSFVITAAALIGAEITVGVLTAIPEPTLITKLVAIILQVLIIAVIGYFAGVEVVGVYDEARNWFSLAKSAHGNPKIISEASKAFLRMVRHIIFAILAIAGLRTKIVGLRVPGAAAAADIRTPPVGERVPPAEVKPPVAEAKPPVAENKPPVAEAKSPAVEQRPSTMDQKAPVATPQPLENAARDAAGRATKAPAQGQLSEAGRSLSKHARGQRAGSRGFPEIKGGPPEINAQAADILDQILNDANKIIKVRPGRGGVEILQVSRPDGTGAIFTMQNGQWTFSYFAENLY